MVNNLGEKGIHDDFAIREKEFAKKAALLDYGQSIRYDLIIEGKDLLIHELKKIAALPGNTRKINGFTALELIENLKANKETSHKILYKNIRGVGVNYKKDLAAKCAQAIAANNITDELRQEVVPLYVNDLRKDPDMIISGDDDFTHTQLADKIEKNRSECKIHIDAYIIGSASIYRLDIEESAKQNIFQILRKKLSK